jgi:hypothetical protein
LQANECEYLAQLKKPYQWLAKTAFEYPRNFYANASSSF